MKKLIYLKSEIDDLVKVTALTKHDKLRNILINYGSEEFGDCIIDEICELFDYKNTNEVQE